MNDLYEILIAIREYEALQEKDREEIRKVARELKADMANEEEKAKLRDLMKETKIRELATKIDDFKNKGK